MALNTIFIGKRATLKAPPISKPMFLKFIPTEFRTAPIPRRTVPTVPNIPPTLEPIEEKTALKAETIGEIPLMKPPKNPSTELRTPSNLL